MMAGVRELTTAAGSTGEESDAGDGAPIVRLMPRPRIDARFDLGEIVADYRWLVSTLRTLADIVELEAPRLQARPSTDATRSADALFIEAIEQVNEVTHTLAAYVTEAY